MGYSTAIKKGKNTIWKKKSLQRNRQYVFILKYT